MSVRSHFVVSAGIAICLVLGLLIFFSSFCVPRLYALLDRFALGKSPVLGTLKFTLKEPWVVLQAVELEDGLGRSLSLIRGDRCDVQRGMTFILPRGPRGSNHPEADQVLGQFKLPWGSALLLSPRTGDTTAGKAGVYLPDYGLFAILDDPTQLQGIETISEGD